MYHTYILKSLKTGKYYIGSTLDLNRRLAEHNNGINRSTRGRGPFTIVYAEAFGTKKEAIRREMEIKSYKGGHLFKELMDRAPR